MSHRRFMYYNFDARGAPLSLSVREEKRNLPVDSAVFVSKNPVEISYFRVQCEGHT